MFSNLRLRPKNESSFRANGSSSSFVQEMGAKTIEFYSKDRIYSTAFLDDEKHIVSGDFSGKIRYWRAEDGEEVGKPINAGSTVMRMAVSQDGKWIVTGEDDGRVTAWNAQSRKKVTAFKAPDRVDAIAVSPDGEQIATGTSSDSSPGNLIVWSISGQKLLGPLEHTDKLAVVKFSPNGGHLIATATSSRESTRVYRTINGHLLIDLGPIGVHGNSLIWASNGRQLFASFDDDVKFLEVFTGEMTPFGLPHEFFGFKHIALASNDSFLAVCHGSLVSFFDTRTYKQIGPVFPHIRPVCRMAISANNDIMLGGDHKVTILRNISDILLFHYLDNWTFLQPESIENVKKLEKTIQQLRDELADSQRAAEEKEEALNGIIRSLHGDLRVHETNSTNFEKTIQELRIQLADSQIAVRQREDSMMETIRSLREDLRSHETSSEKTIHQLRESLANSHQKSFDIVRAHEQKHQCEALYSQGHIIDASNSLLEFVDTLSKAAKANKFIMDWLSDFTSRCITMLEKLGDDASNTEDHEKTLRAYSTALLLTPPSPSSLLVKWANIMLLHGSPDALLGAAAKFRLPAFHLYSPICDALVMSGCIREAIECFRQMQRDLEQDASNYNERARWEKDFKRRCREALEYSGDAAMESCNYDEAIYYFSNILSLEPDSRMEILIKRSKARSSMSMFEDALSDADEAIRLIPSSHHGYEMRYIALHKAKRHLEAVEAFETMLVKLERSSDARIRELRHRYVDARPAIRDIVNQTIRPMPRVLIDTTTGCLCDKKKQAEAFKALPVYAELVSTMTMELDYARIWREVKEFFRYVMFSHRWEDDEPLLQKVERTTVYKLEVSPANTKLQSFCKLVDSFGFRWAWSDTCCVDKVNNVVLQESLVAMFSWYRGSSLTVVHLIGVWSDSQESGDLYGSIWNTRAWTYQEYVAAKVVQFYTEDWKPYLGLTMFNHKESHDVVSEMGRVSGISSQQLAVLSPGLDRAREKLYLASTRQTTLVEDIAYSLLGIFNVSIPVIYGEGHRAVGRLLEHILMGSGDVTILAWTGPAGTYNSCLPMDLTVYSQLLPLHVPSLIETSEMNQAATNLRSSLPDLTPAMTLYDRLHELPSPSMAANRLRLPGIVFLLTDLAHVSGPDPQTGFHVYHAITSTFGNIDIKTADDLTETKDLYLVHPWIGPLLDQEFSCGAAALDRTTQALRIVVRLRQPFGALLFKSLSRVEYQRVAADSLIMVQVHEEVPLTDLVDNIRTIEVH